MTLLITGGTGFVLSNLAKLWLEQKAGSRCVVLDIAPWDRAAERFFAPVRDRLTFIRADVLNSASWEAELAGENITHVVHGVAVTPSREEEQAEPGRVLEVNILATVNVLEWARRQPALQRFIFTSSGAVYAPDSPAGLVAEVEPPGPSTLYAISKVTGEAVTHRYSELFGLDAISVRFSSVYGPMERPTPSRARQSALYHLARLALAGKSIRVYGLDGGGDWIYSGDVATALLALLDAAKLRHQVYNVAYGDFVTLRALLAILAEAIPDLRWEMVAEPGEADVVTVPEKRHGRWGAYDVTRLRDELEWQPRPIRTAIFDYVEWLTKTDQEDRG